MKDPVRILRRLAGFRLGFRQAGRFSIAFFYHTGGVTLLLFQTMAAFLGTPLKWKQTLEQMHKIGVASLPLVSLTALFTGLVLSLQSAYQLRLFAAQQFTADLVALSVTRELGPVLTAMVVAGRVGASIAAELGTMKVTEQIDALRSLAVNPVQYLVVPRFLAGMVMLCGLAMYADVIGIFGGYLIAVLKLGMSHTQYLERTLKILWYKDIMTGLFKAFVFGGIISLVGCYFGMKASGGAEGVGRATTLAVVTAMILIIASDALFTWIFYFF